MRYSGGILSLLRRGARRKPAPEPVPEPQGVRVLGHLFVPLSRLDWYGFAGAEPGTLICHCEDGTTLLLTPDHMVEEHLPEGEKARQWTFVVAT